MYKSKCVHCGVNIDSEFLHNYFKSKKHSYLVTMTGKSTKFLDLIDKESYIISEVGIRFGLMKLIKQTKDNVTKNINSGKCILKPTLDKTYFQINRDAFSKVEDQIDNITEIDLTKAYLESAFRLNMIDEKLYKRLGEIKGENRKIALGSLATKKYHKMYDSDGVLREQSIETNELLKEAWFNIVSETDKTMNEMLYMNNYSYLFYWVDNLFTNIEASEFKVPDNIKVKYKENKSLNYIIQQSRVNIFMNDGRNFNLRFM